MDGYLKALGILNIAYGAIGFVASAIVLFAADGFQSLFHSFDATHLSFYAVAAVAFHLIIGIPCIAGGYFILQYREGARTLLTLVSALNLLNLPFGTILGAYGLWVLSTDEVEPLFRRARELGQAKAARANKLSEEAVLKAAEEETLRRSSNSIIPSTQE